MTNIYLPNCTKHNLKKSLKSSTEIVTTAKKISEQFSISYLVSKVLAIRGYEENSFVELNNYLDPKLKNLTPNPLEVLGMKEACLEMKLAVENHYKLAVFCDYDVDGLTSASLLINNLRNLGITAHCYVPNRFKHGYGLNQELIENAIKDGCNLGICVDFGTTNITEIEFANSHKFPIIIIDHHHIGKNIPSVKAFINPNQTNCPLQEHYLCSAGLTWYFLLALYKTLNKEHNLKEDLDYVALATICDMVPLKKNNRILVHRGLSELNNSKKVGILALKKLLGFSEIEASKVAFSIGPRINAAGRLGKAELVIELLTTTNPLQAEKIAKELDSLNKERQNIEENMQEIAFKQIIKLKSFPFSFTIYDPSFSSGVIGIVAQRIVEKFNRPTAVLAKDDKILKASLRSCNNLSIVEALEYCKEYLIKFGGHKAAGGCSLLEENLELFRDKFNEYATNFFNNTPPFKELEIDVETELSEITPSAIEEINKLAPFGLGNATPKFKINSLLVRNIYSMQDKHSKLEVYCEKNRISATALLWNYSKISKIAENIKANFVVKPEINNFRGQANVQLIIQDIEVL